MIPISVRTAHVRYTEVARSLSELSAQSEARSLQHNFFRVCSSHFSAYYLQVLKVCHHAAPSYTPAKASSWVTYTDVAYTQYRHST